MNDHTVVALAWATKKRHIAVDGIILCDAISTSGGYSRKNGSYNGLALSGIPDFIKQVDDDKYAHGGGIIKPLPLEQQPYKIIPSSICAKCLKKYNKFFTQT